MLCPICDSSTIELDPAAGNSVCTSCGTVLEESTIVADITFGETSAGGAVVQGSYVASTSKGTRSAYRGRGATVEAREQTLVNGRKRIQTLASALNLPERIGESATRYFNLAVNMQFVQGRRGMYVVASCLYIACRMEKTSHMLIDFSDLLEVVVSHAKINVFVLGSTYLRLTRAISVQLPLIDPSLYISRFAALLEFGDETQKVALDASRLVARMSRDWMHIGRRPSGICGACLLLAARMNNFRRNVEEVVQVVKIADVTLRRRLKEFGETSSGSLTVQDFRTIWLDEVADPPAFVKGLRKATMLSMDQAEEEAHALKESSKEMDLERRKGKRKASDMDDDGSDNEARQDSPDDEEDEEDDEEDGGAKSGDPRFDDNPLLDSVIENDINSTLESSTGRLLSNELDKAHKKRFTPGPSRWLTVNGCQAAGSSTLSVPDRTAEQSGGTEEMIDPLDGLDEDELDSFILSPDEVLQKSRLWMEMNREYLQDLADKQTGPDGELKPESKKRIRRKYRPKDSATATGTTASEATKSMLTKKRFSKKINYGAIDSLFNRSTSEEPEGFITEPTPGHRRAGTPFSERGERGRSRTPLIVPEPTWSRQGTPAPIPPLPGSSSGSSLVSGSGILKAVRKSPLKGRAAVAKKVSLVESRREPDEDEGREDEDEGENEDDEDEDEQGGARQSDWRRLARGAQEEEMFGDYEEEV